jgi:hypothetical protein
MNLFSRNQGPISNTKYTSVSLVILLNFLCLTAISLTPQEIASNAFPSVVVVIAQDGSGAELSLGSGFFMAPGIIATNLHVIEGASKVRIRPIGSAEEHEVVGFTAVDYDNDLVLLKVNNTSVSPLKVVEDTATTIGDDVYVIGNPVGLEGTFSKGMISGKREKNNHRIIQITAPISQGSSGGPVLSANGDVIGVAVAYIAEGQNLNFAVPAFCLSMLMKNQHSSRPLTDFESKTIKKISPSILEAEQTPIALGNVVLHIGMTREDVLEKLGTHCRVSPVINNNHCIVSQKVGSEYHVLGFVDFENEKLTSITRDLGIGSTPVSSDVLLLFKSLVSRLQEVGDGRTPICIIEAGTRNSTEVDDYFCHLKFGSYTIHMAVGGINGEYSIYLQETLGKFDK